MYQFNNKMTNIDISVMEAFVCLVLQKVSEKVGGAEGTKLDDDFREMEKVKLKYGH